MDDKAKAAKVHETVKKQVDQKMINEAKADPSIKALVEQQIYTAAGVEIVRDKRKRTKAQREAENEAYLRFGRLMGGLKAEAISVKKRRGKR